MLCYTSSKRNLSTPLVGGGGEVKKGVIQMKLSVPIPLLSSHVFSRRSGRHRWTMTFLLLMAGCLLGQLVGLSPPTVARATSTASSDSLKLTKDPIGTKSQDCQSVKTIGTSVRYTVTTSGDDSPAFDDNYA